MKSFTRICKTQEDMREFAQALSKMPADKLPLEVSITRILPRRKEERNRLLNAHIRDIARHRHGSMTVPERLFERILDDIKRADVWPRYSNPEPDEFTGEVLYRPMSRAHLSDKAISGIVNWLELYMQHKGIVSHAPVDRWS